MRILYLHGLASSKEANTAKVLSTLLPNDQIKAIDIPMKPYEALMAIFRAMCEFHPHMLIGNSLGGFYAMFFEGPLKVLINPALRPDEELASILGGYGEFPYLKPRGDGIGTFTYTKGDEEDLRTMRKAFEDSIKDIDHVSQTYAIFAAYDEVVHDRDYFNRVFDPKHATTFIGNHRLSDGNIEHILVPLIDWLRVG